MLKFQGLMNAWHESLSVSCAFAYLWINFLLLFFLANGKGLLFSFLVLFYRLQPLMVVDFDDDAQNRFIELTESRFSWQLLFRWISKSFILEIDAFISLFTSQNATVIHCAPARYRPKLKLILHCKPKFLTLTHSMGNDKILPILHYALMNFRCLNGENGQK